MGMSASKPKAPKTWTPSKGTRPFIGCRVDPALRDRLANVATALTASRGDGMTYDVGSVLRMLAVRGLPALEAEAGPPPAMPEPEAAPPVATSKATSKKRSKKGGE